MSTADCCACVYSVAMNAWELVAGSYFISVRCGPQPVQFTIVTELFTGEMPRSGDRTAGLVCSGEMVFHHVVVCALCLNPATSARITPPKSCCAWYHHRRKAWNKILLI
jgi:hypothetical protein